MTKSNTGDDEPIDAHQLLAKHRMIGVVWRILDVQEVRPDLTDDQAWEVPQQVDRRHNADLGISWLTLEIMAEDLYGHAPKYDQSTEADHD